MMLQDGVVYVQLLVHVRGCGLVDVTSKDGVNDYVGRSSRVVEVRVVYCTDCGILKNLNKKNSS